MAYDPKNTAKLWRRTDKNGIPVLSGYVVIDGVESWITFYEQLDKKSEKWADYQGCGISLKEPYTIPTGPPTAKKNPPPPPIDESSLEPF